MQAILRFLLRLMLVAAGLVFAASLAITVGVLLAAWWARATWARLTGRPISPFIVRVHPADAFRSTCRPRRAVADVTDVEPK